MEILPSTPPSFPPTEEDAFVWLRLLRSPRVGPVTFHKLLARFGSAAAALDALPGIAREAGIEGFSPCPPGVVEAEMRQAARCRARVLLHGREDYPHALAEIDSPPPVLWARGRTELLQGDAVALVGARNASSLGLRMTRALATGLGEAGRTVVSGLARGIDTAAHEASLATGTVAVFAGGVDVVYPAENEALAARIALEGCILSEQPMGLRPQARHFPRRNRLVSGLSRAVVVVEAAAKSGTLITARDALDQGREVLAVPGHPFDARAAGCNMLIREGATLVRGPKDVLAALPVPEEAEPEAPAPRQAPAPTGDLAANILSRLSPSPTPEDALFGDLGRPANEVAECLVLLELDGRIERDPGGFLRLAV